jgi:hypothetical protein
MTRLVPRALALGAIATLLAIGGASATPGAGASPSTLGRGTLAGGDRIKTDQL